MKKWQKWIFMDVKNRVKSRAYKNEQMREDLKFLLEIIDEAGLVHRPASVVRERSTITNSSALFNGT